MKEGNLLSNPNPEAVIRHRRDDGRPDDLRDLPDDYWLRIASKISERGGEAPSPMGIRAHALIRAFGIASGQFSPLETKQEGTRDTGAERLYSESAVSPAGVETVGSGIPSASALDLSLANHAELLDMMDPRSAEIIRADHREADALPEKYSPMLYFRMPGGVDVFLKGYIHTDEMQDRRGSFLKAMTKEAAVIALEGAVDVADGTSLRVYYRAGQHGQSTNGFGELMQDAMNGGFRGVFAEVDPRDWSKVSLDLSLDEGSLPDSFFVTYFEYLKRENPALAGRIGDVENFRNLLRKQTHRKLAILEEESSDKTTRQANGFVADVDGGGEISVVPTGLEFGSQLFSDALSSIRLHVLAKLMADGKIPKGPILDFQGTAHLSGKQFFMRYPEYAMEVVLRSVPEILSTDVSDIFGRKSKKIQKIEKRMKDPDWERIVRKLGTISFMNSRFLVEPHVYKCDFFKEYGINPGSVMPTDAVISEIVERTSVSGHET